MGGPAHCGSMLWRARASYGVLILASVSPFPFGAWPPSVFVAWAAVAAGLGLGLAHAPRAARVALATLGAFVLVTLVGGGLTLGRTGLGISPSSWSTFAMGCALMALWVPAGVFTALSAPKLPARLAHAGIAMTALWAIFFAYVLAATELHGRPPIGGTIHILVAMVGAALVVGALGWCTFGTDMQASRASA